MSDHARTASLAPRAVRALSSDELRAIVADRPGPGGVRYVAETRDDAARVLSLRLVAQPRAKGARRPLIRAAVHDKELRAAMQMAGVRRQRRAAAKADAIARRAP